MGLNIDGKTTPTAADANCRAAGTVGDHFGMMVSVMTGITANGTS